LISPRGLIYPQLPMGYHNKKQMQGSYNRNAPRTIYCITNISTGESEKLTAKDIVKKYGLDLRQVYRGATTKTLINKKYKVETVKQKTALFIATDIKTGEEVKEAPRVRGKMKIRRYMMNKKGYS